MISEVEVRFVSEAPQRTRVELEHRNLDRHGRGWESERDGVGAEAGCSGSSTYWPISAEAASHPWTSPAAGPPTMLRFRVRSRRLNQAGSGLPTATGCGSWSKRV